MLLGAFGKGAASGAFGATGATTGAGAVPPQPPQPHGAAISQQQGALQQPQPHDLQQNREFSRSFKGWQQQVFSQHGSQQQGFSQQPHGFSQQPQVFAQQPQVLAQQHGFSQQPQVLAQQHGFSQQPQVFSQQPQVFSQQPQVFAQQPHGFAQQPQVFPQQHGSGAQHFAGPQQPHLQQQSQAKMSFSPQNKSRTGVQQQHFFSHPQQVGFTQQAGSGAQHFTAGWQQGTEAH